MSSILSAWLRRWSWAIAMIVAIVITVGGLIILESGRLRIAREYEIALQAKTAVGTLQALSLQGTLIIAAERAYALTHEPAYNVSIESNVAHFDTLADNMVTYYRQRNEAVALEHFQSARNDFETHVRTAASPAMLNTDADADAASFTAASALSLHALRYRTAELIDTEEHRAVLALEASHAGQRASTLCVAAVSALNIILFILLFRNLGGQLDTQSREQRVLIDHQDALDLLVRERTGQLQTLAWHLQTVSEDEKSQLARELHDELGSILTATRMDVAGVHARLREPEPLLAGKLARALAALDQGIALKRRIIEDMRPTVLSNFGLTTALRNFAEEAAQRNHWRLRLSLPADDFPLDEATSIALFRIAQETLTNAAKYARASELALTLEFGTEVVMLEITDNGIGITHADLQRSKTHGLLGMRQRVAARGGSFEISRRVPHGTIMRAVMPRTASASADMENVTLPTAS